MQSSAWLLGSVTAQNPVQRPFKVIFSATQVSTQVLTMALDSISIRLGPCSPCTTGCDFDVDGDLCGWKNPAAGDVQWEPWAGAGLEYGVGPEDDFSKPGFGYYMVLDSLDPDSAGAALLKSPPYQSPGGCLSLSFYYTLHGVSNETALNVYAAAVESEGEVGSPLLTLRGEHGPSWSPGAVNYTGTETIQFVLEGIYRGKPGLAVDSVRISTCEEVFAQCDFNDNSDPFCGWINSGDDDNTWTRTNQTTPTEETGPPGDYPHGEGYYIYTEGGSLQPGQSMLLSSRAFCTETEACVEFYYQMYAVVLVNTQLRVLLEGPSGIRTLLWTRTGSQSPEWLLGSVTVPYGGPQPSRVVFEVIRGNNPYLDVALDNISVRRGPCAATGTPVPPATSITTTSTQAGPSVSVPPSPPVTCLPIPDGSTTPAAATGATPHISTISKPQPTTFNTTASRTTTTTQGGFSSATTKPVAPQTSSPSPATLPLSSHTTTIARPTSTTPKTVGTSQASSSQGSQTTATHPSSTQTATPASTTSFSPETSPARTTSSHSKTTSGSSTSTAPSPGQTSFTSGSLPSGTLRPTSHASSHSYITSRPQTAATIHATTQSSHVSSHQTSATTGGPSTSHTEPMKPTPSSIATASSSTTTTTSGSFQPSTQSATTSHSDVATSHATLPTTASSQASTTHRSSTSAVQATTRQTTSGTTPSSSSHQATTGGPSTSHTEPVKPTPSSIATAASSTTTTTTTTTTSGSFQPSTQSTTTSHSDVATSHATVPTTASSQASTTHRSSTSAVQATSSQTTPGATSSSTTSTAAADHTTLTTTMAGSLGPNATSSVSSTSQAGHGTSATPSLDNSSATRGTTGARPNTEPGSKPPSPSATPSGPSHLATVSSSTVQVNPTTRASTPKVTSGQNATTTTPGHSQPPRPSTTTSTGHPPTVGHISSTSTSQVPPTTTRLSPTPTSSIYTSPTPSGLTSRTTSHVSDTTPTVGHTSTASATPHVVPSTTLGAVEPTARTSGLTTMTSTKRSSPGTTAGPVVTTSISATQTSTAKATPTVDDSTRTTTKPPAVSPGQDICTVSGDPHYTTYDGRLFHFMGTCTYLLSAVCNATPGLPTFQVQATNEHRGGNTQVSYVKSIQVEVYSIRIVLLKGRRVTVDGQRVTLPASVAEGKVSVRLSGTFVLVQTDFGLWVRFNGNHHVEITAPPSYMGKLCGLCGNYNGQTADDNLMPDGSSAGTDADRLGESWQVEDAEDSASCTNAGDPGKCDQDLEAEAQKPTSCGILTDPEGPFAPCHSEVPPGGPLENCVYDLCASGGEVTLLCNALQSYADRCAQAGVPVAWRNSSFCPLNCPLGSTYTPCGPACPATCTDPDSPNSCPEMPCVEGCVCDQGTVLSGDQCVALAQCGCTDSAGQYHAVGDHWMGNEDCTQRCTCGPHNNVTCEAWACSVVQECRPLEGLLGCQDAGVAACHVAGDPHYFTFDGTMVSFMGTCTYTLVNVCLSNPRLPSFNIVGKNEERGQPEESYLRQVTVEVAGYSVTLQKSRRVLIDGVRVRTPVEGRIPGVSITISGIYVVLETDFGLVVKFDGNHHLEIQLPGTYFSKVCGMCGNFNNNSQDDLLMPNGHLAANDSQFGNSWKAPGDADQGCQPDHREDLEPHCTSTERGPLHALCSEILQPKYLACHSVIDPQLFIQTCLYDMCEYQGMVSVLCDNIQSYVEACKSQGVPAISWRNSSFCPLPCPPHSHYTECAPPCPATCCNLYAPASCQRPTTCVEGCTCDSGYVLSDDSCVSMRDCGCLDAQHNYYGPGDNWVTANCHERCTCEGNGIITCQDFRCQPGSSCTLSSAGLRYCQPIKFHQCVISGDPHYRTFDFFAHHFQGRATYVLTQTLANLPGSLVPLSVAGRNLRRFPFHRFSFLREVYISVYGYQITLMQGRKMAVDGLRTRPPFYSRDSRLQITQRGRRLIVQTDFGLSVSFDGRDFAEIVLPSTYQEHVGGLCGNYDGQRNNEYMMPDGTWTRSLNAFGNSWKVSSQRMTLGQNHIRTRREEEPTDETESGFEVECSTEQLMLINGTDICGALSDPQGPFAACHSAISPDTFQEGCVYDLCALFNDTELLCQDYEAYVNLCQEEGVTLASWRQETGCELSCPAHTTYQPCMSACPATCANLAASSDCQAPCVEGCASDPGYILSGLESVPYNQCGCTSNDQYYEINDTFLTDDCSQRCTCHSTGTLECEAAGCLEGQVCTVANYARGCFQESPCLSSPCQNEGTCFEGESPEAFSCLCLGGYTGPFCEETPMDDSPTPPPSLAANTTLSYLPPDKADNHLVAILAGVLVPLAIILIAVMIACFCRHRNRKKKEEDRLAVLPTEVQSRTSAPGQSRITPF